MVKVYVTVGNSQRPRMLGVGQACMGSVADVGLWATTWLLPVLHSPMRPGPVDWAWTRRNRQTDSIESPSSTLAPTRFCSTGTELLEEGCRGRFSRILPWISLLDACLRHTAQRGPKWSMVRPVLGRPWSKTLYWHGLCHCRWIQAGGQGPQGVGYCFESV